MKTRSPDEILRDALDIFPGLTPKALAAGRAELPIGIDDILGGGSDLELVSRIFKAVSDSLAQTPK